MVKRTQQYRTMPKIWKWVNHPGEFSFIYPDFFFFITDFKEHSYYWNKLYVFQVALNFFVISPDDRSSISNIYRVSYMNESNNPKQKIASRSGLTLPEKTDSSPSFLYFLSGGMIAFFSHSRDFFLVSQRVWAKIW